jgi:hypothetical protein
MQCHACAGTDLWIDGSDYFCKTCNKSKTTILHERAQAQLGLSSSLPGQIGNNVAQRVMAASRHRDQQQPRAQPTTNPSPGTDTRKFRRP